MHSEKFDEIGCIEKPEILFPEGPDRGEIFDAEDFIANLTLHIPPKNVQYIRR